ncbi:hypothetical protein AciX9_1292 [Granulicella tundricola MP5ACTX9]|uniref:PIN domain-containing protein n=1 Tax=Granulicella tundricola (strain ATCC BAA-1859 / DSM 23138 / MP5ACTX9) TaxID=1198114 RepID=E8X590_GRATM|nr:hypothetical protein AciX9_1292 [Granulicella tundricola MP5ACTX9]
MSSYTTTLIERFAGRGVLIDTNLLLLYAIGKYDPDILSRESFDRVATYSIEDYQLLGNLISLFRQKVTTPYVLAEVSNWIGYLARAQEVECLRGLIDSLDTFTELQVDSFELGKDASFPFLGLTDMALAAYANDYLIVTDDARLIFHLNELGREALNINHLRQEIWLMN